MDVKIGLTNESEPGPLMTESEETAPISKYNFKLNLEPLDQYY